MTGRYASHSELTRKQPKGRISAKNWDTWFENTKANQYHLASASKSRRKLHRKVFKRIKESK